MGKFVQTLSILDRLIAKLEANTGGEPLLPEEQSSGLEACLCKKKMEEISIHEQLQQEGVEIEKKPNPKKKKEEGGKHPKKKEEEGKKLPEGTDPDLLIFADVDLRVSEIVECWKHPDSDYLYCEKIMVGKELRHIASGLQDHVKLEDMKGKVIVMANLKPRMLGGFESNGMVVCSSDKDNKTFELLVPDGPVGQRLYLQGYEELFASGQAIQPLMKKKTLERCLQHFKTDEEGFVVWKGIKVRTAAGFIRSTIAGGNVS